ncbi:SpvB/TcaC N-terminal domain-containing protein [Wolbachia endosymbiont (group B) of Agriphila straminella]|uniref:SpvB/TcaC N-terminal domain-containing protein n=1 Tax=Wolbachia endosymbiont (group B) of Agriphila straminella TaxID=2953972 RepID=UPI002226FBD2|nr:SpvB/TcaC N-terminal domain-containing protein [Wolbachia endosymbiont (group B) of Agriphila straminella]
MEHNKDTSQKSTIEAKKLELPKGGGAIKGISEAFQANSFTGTGSFSIPIPLPTCRNFSPSLSVDYSSGGGNGVFGIGFNVSIASIIRKTSKKIPTYDDEDVFVLIGADDLVAINQTSNSKYDITYYQPRVEGLFAKIERLISRNDNTVYWQVTSKDGSVAIYGKNKQAQIYDPKSNSRIAEWLLEELSDVYGNKIFYYYRSSTANLERRGGGKVIDRITYGYNQELNYNHFEVLFDYGENDFISPIDKKYNKERKAIIRPDPFTSHITGFAVRTELLCRAIRIYHRFDAEPILVNGTYFDYDEKPTITYLRAVKQVGYYERGEKRFTKTTPTLVFSHTSDDSTYVSTVSAVTLKDGNKPSKELLQILKEQEYIFKKDSAEIVAENSAWRIKDSEKDLLIKEKGNFLDLHNPNNKNSFKPVKIEGINKNFPGYLNDQRFQSVDLYQEGIEGILYNDGNTILYFRPNGNGEFAQAKLLENFPSLLRKTTYSLMSMEGNGELQLYVNESGFQGYHDFEGKWSEFKPLESQVVNISSELQEMIDVTGDGRTDIVVFEGENVRVYPSIGKKGYKQAIYSKAPKDLPNQRISSESTLVRFADMFGDGKSHLVKIENGKVECWPNLGYGKFGEKVVFKNAPYFRNGLNAKRLYFADIDGSGTTDLVYANHNSLDIYYNNSGNSFSKPVNLKLPVDYNHVNRIEFTDILGNGTNCLLISYLDQSLKLQHLYYDFYNGVKPHLLKQIDNNMGNITRLHYAASTKFYLEDRKENRPWVTSLPFPVQVIEKMETIDNIVGSKLTNKYRYHHGFYDYTEKEFRGFGFVETWDTEDFSMINQTEKEHYVAPIYTKTWYHTGAYKKAKDLVESYRKEFYQGDEKALRITPQVFDENIISIEDKRQAYRAIQGQMLRQEVYGLDENPDLYQHPYSVTESSACVKLLQSSTNSSHKVFKYGIFFVNLQETINYHYERNCCDPRIQHDFVLEVDEYGNVIKSASITYPRRIEPNNYSEQQKLHATLERNFYVNNTKEFYLLGALYKSQAFEIGGLVSGYTNINDLRTHVTQSLQNTIKFEENLNYTSPQARLLSENHNYYWNEAQNATLSLGSVTQQALLHHTEAMAFSNSQIKEVFADKITSDQMLKDLGYKKTSNNFWWALSPTQYYYGSDKYYLPEKVIDVFGSETAVVYDQYNLLPIKTVVKATESSNYETTAEYDYQRLTPVKLTDHNDNISEVILNPLGVVIATSIYGSENGEKKGDKPLLEYQVRKNPNFEDVLGTVEGANGPEHYLQNATSFFYYYLEAWRKNGQPVHVINLQRETHVSDGTSTRIRQVVTHIDGFGRNLETKMLVNSDSESEKWLASGRVVYNNKGTEVKKYEPFYSNFPLYDFEESVRNQGVSDTLYYDPLLRNIRIDTAKGFFSKVEFDSWVTRNFDLNDTVKDSEYYKEFTEKWNRASRAEKVALKDEKDALSKAEKHYNTPTIEHLDSLGRKFLQIETLSKDEQSNVELKSHVKLDIQGNELESVDSRFYEHNQGKSENEKIKNFRHVYSMAWLLKSTSIDAGETWNLANVAGSSVYSWNSRGFCTHTEYDRLQRPVKVKVTNQKLKLDNIVEKFFYSENIQDKVTNRYGTLIAHYDQAGLTEAKENDFKGQTLKSSFLLRKNYKQEADWKSVESIVTAHADLEQEVFNSTAQYNALGEIVEKTDPQSNAHIPIYDIAGRVKQIKLKKQGEDIKTYVSDISYNSKGQRISITYGNSVTTSYNYDPKTFRLIKLESVKEQKKLQSINYTYDPVGNITRMNDESYKTIFPNNKNIDTSSDYHYDSLYRLSQATGKEHPSLSENRGGSDKEDYITPIPHLSNQNAISNYTEYYNFDHGSNITKIRHTGVHSSTKEFYISNKSNRSLPIVDSRPVNENDIDESYDESGNLLKLSGSRNLRWNYRDNIAYVDIITRPSGKNDSEYYVYDSSGQRVRKITETYQNNEANHTKVEKIYFGDIEVTRTYQGNNLNKEKYTVHAMDDKSRVALHHYWTKGSPENVETKSQDRYQLSNHLDSVALELNDNAEIITYEEYLPFGGTALIAGKTARGVTEKEYRYSGKERDDSTGLYYYGMRYYSTWLLKWINPDPAGTVDGLNLYQFVGGNPVNSVDVGGMTEREIRKDLGEGTSNKHVKMDLDDTSSLSSNDADPGIRRIGQYTANGENKKVIDNLKPGFLSTLLSTLKNLFCSIIQGDPLPGKKAKKILNITRPSIKTREEENFRQQGTISPSEGWSLIGYHGTSQNWADSMELGVNNNFQGISSGLHGGEGFYITKSAENAYEYARTANAQIKNNIGGEGQGPIIMAVFGQHYDSWEPGKDYAFNTTQKLTLRILKQHFDKLNELRKNDPNNLELINFNEENLRGSLDKLEQIIKPRAYQKLTLIPLEKVKQVAPKFDLSAPKTMRSYEWPLFDKHSVLNKNLPH